MQIIEIFIIAALLMGRYYRVEGRPINGKLISALMMIALRNLYANCLLIHAYKVQSHNLIDFKALN